MTEPEIVVTDEMIEAGCRAVNEGGSRWTFPSEVRAIYRAMLDAAPVPPNQTEKQEPPRGVAERFGRLLP